MTSEASETLDVYGFGNPSEQGSKIGFGAFGNLVEVI